MEENWIAITAIATCVAGLAAFASAFFNFLAARASTKLTEHRLGWEFENSLTQVTPELRRALGDVGDGVDPAIRDVMLPFLVLYSQVWAAHRNDLFPDANWQGLRPEFAYWIRKESARSAWAIMRRYCDAWPDGFVEHVDEELKKRTGPIAESENEGVAEG